MMSEEFILIWGRISQTIIVFITALACYVLIDIVVYWIKRRIKR